MSWVPYKILEFLLSLHGNYSTYNKLGKHPLVFVFWKKSSRMGKKNYKREVAQPSMIWADLVLAVSLTVLAVRGHFQNTKRTWPLIHRVSNLQPEWASYNPNRACCAHFSFIPAFLWSTPNSFRHCGHCNTSQACSAKLAQEIFSGSSR